jgi:phospholipase C
MALPAWLQTLLTRLPEQRTPMVPLTGSGSGNLSKIDHIVVLMMENRSFDHMLGYLKLNGVMSDVEGLEAGMANEYEGRSYPVHALGRAGLEGFNPEHGGSDVDQQLENGNGGFVANFATTHHKADPGLVMGYYDGGDLPVYDHLARNYCVCDHWFSSVPGATWPNRLFSITGGAIDREDAKPPIYAERSFVRKLERTSPLVSWRWYSYFPGSLRMIDPKYRLSHHDHFAYVDRRAPELPPRQTLKGMLLGDAVDVGDLLLHEDECFLDQAKAGTLPQVSWIDPNFQEPTGYTHPSNDDHPPSDIRPGQELVLMIYRALISNQRAWERTLFVIAYDEHGGLYDHVPPPMRPQDKAPFNRLGVRVPALIVSPWATRGVCKQQFDHTSIIKTILTRFCQVDGKIPDMGLRTTEAADLGYALTASEPQPTPSIEEMVSAVAAWQAVDSGKPALGAPLRPPETLDEFRSGIVAASRHLRKRGLQDRRP